MSGSSLNVFITGANRGIGLALAKQFKIKGHNVVGTSRNVSADVTEELRKIATQVIQLDLNQVESIQTLSTKLTAFDKIDILINNSGVYERDQLETVTMETMHSSFQINAVGPLLVIKALKPKFNVSTKIIQITSRMGSISDNTSGGSYSYRASKAALNSINKSLSIDLPQHICVAVHPGYIQTRMTNQQGDMPPELCAEKLSALILGFDASMTGKFVHRDGQLLDWILGLGVDLLNLQRIVRLANKYPLNKLENRILSSIEKQYVPKIAESSTLDIIHPWVRYLGLSWAAKEALFKACSPYASGYSWSDASVIKINGKPSLQIHATHPNVKVSNTHLSISHEGPMLVAIVLVEGEVLP